MLKNKSNKNTGFAWSESCNVGEPALDLQRRKLLSALAELHAQIGEDGSIRNARVEQLLYFLQGYSKLHFETETQYLRKIDFPELESHLSELKQLGDDLDHLYASAILGSLDPVRLEAFTRRWAAGHLLEADLRYKSFIPPANPT